MTMTGRATSPLRLCALAAASALAAVGGPAQAAPLQIDRTSGCRLMAPRSMPQGATAWIGACAAGLAQGPGVVRVTGSPGRAPAIFYGTMRAGRPVRGVIETTEGLEIGDFRDGEMIELPDDPNAGIKQFHDAVQGAEAAARHFKAVGNVASAAFYRSKADLIDRTSPGGH